MPKFRYKARDKDGLPINGELEVDDEDLLRDKLEKMGYVLTYAEEENDMFEADIFARFRRVKSKELVEFSVEIATLIDAGIPLLDSLQVMEDQLENPLFKDIVSQVRKDISGGSGFSEALAKHPKTFSKLYVSMVRAGEATGELDKILTHLAEYLEIEQNNRAKVKSALMYPATMMAVAVMVVVFLMTRVLPSFAKMFSSAGVQLPLPTRIVMALSNFMISKWYYILIFIGIAWYSVYLYINTEKGRYYFDLFKFRIPIMGRLIKKSVISRFSRTFGTLVSSSVPILGALDIVKDTVGNAGVAAVVQNIRNSIEAGGQIAEQIELSGIFPSMVGKMVAVGENTGALDKMLLKISDFYDNEVENEIKGLTSILEPVLIVGMGLVVGVIVLSVMLPMFDMMKVARR